MLILMRVKIMGKSSLRGKSKPSKNERSEMTVVDSSPSTIKSETQSSPKRFLFLQRALGNHSKDSSFS